jgi:site-specific recombinase XerD
MRSTFKVLFFLKRDKQKVNGTVPLFCRITVDGKEARFGMKCDVNPKYWDVKTGKATGRTADANRINTLVDDTRAAIYRVYRELQEKENYVTAKKIKNVFLGIEVKHQTLLELFDKHNKEREQQVGVNLTKSTLEKYVITRNLLADFIKYQFDVSDLPVKEVNQKFIADFDLYMTGLNCYARNTVVGYMKKFRHIIEMAIANEWIYKNPFRGEYELKWEKVDRGYLTQTELETLMDCRLEEHPKLEEARDVFVFCAFTGLAYGDVLRLSYDEIKSSFDGKLWIKGKRKKTGTEYNIPLLNIPKMILEKYKGKVEGGMALPVYPDNIVFNNRLKKVGKLCGINKKLTSHLARHTFATQTLTKGVSIESVSRMLGHTNISTTQIYARITDKKIGTEMSSFADKVKSWDAKLHIGTKEEDLSLEDAMCSLHITIGRAADKVWEELAVKVWNSTSNIDRETFMLGMKEKQYPPKTIRDFYIAFMDSFLESLNDKHNNQVDSENTFVLNAINF